MIAIVLVAAAMAGVAAWVMLRHPASPVAAGGSRAPAPPLRSGAGGGAESAAHSRGLEIANSLAATRLWQISFTAAAANSRPSEATHAVDRRVRDNVIAMLAVDSVHPDCFPRRPTLMPQLLQAVNDPDAQSERIARMIAHDPVLSADVLRLANSSLYRTAPTPVETIQRAIVVCGADALRGMLGAAMLRPVFRATRRNFPRFPRILWERSERAARAAELFAMRVAPQDRFEAQMAVLLGALGPLVVYGAALDVYARNPHLTPNAAVCIDLIRDVAPAMAARIARDWAASPRLVAALSNDGGEFLATARGVGELLGTLALLESRIVLEDAYREQLIAQAGIDPDLAESIRRALIGAV